MYDFEFELGDGVKDVVTGYTGVIMSRAQFLTGCNQYGVGKTTLDKDGKRHDWEYFDENRLKKNGKNISLNKKNKEVRGFDGNLPRLN